MRAATKRPRPTSGTETRQRQDRLTIRLSPDERAQLMQQADAAGLTLASYGRARILAKPTTRAVRRPPVDAAVLAHVLAQLGRVGGNLNQLVKYLHLGDYNALNDAPAVLAELRQVGVSIMGALGRSSRHDH